MMLRGSCLRLNCGMTGDDVVMVSACDGWAFVYAALF
jgi:hypothetical protein